MDTFDRTAIGLLCLLVPAAFIVAGSGPETPPALRLPVTGTAAPSVDPAGLDRGVRQIRTLLDSSRLEQAEVLIAELAGRFPYRGEIFMLKGDLFMRRQDPVKAVHEYRQAVELEPDLLDRKTPLYQGKKIKAAVEEALTEIEHRARQRPGDASLRQARKTIYSLYRMIAGSCG